MKRADYQKIRSELDFNVRGGRWGLYAFQDIMTILIIMCLYSIGGLASYVAPLILAILMFRGFGFMHEAVHGVMAPYRRFNDVLGVLWGSICFLPYNQWKAGHLQHHYWAGNIEKDPVMKLCLYVKNGGKMPFAVEAGWKLWIPVLAILQQTVFWWNCCKLIGTAKFKILDGVSAAAPLVLWASLFYFGGLTLSLTLYLPAIVLYLVMIEIVNFPHHLELPQFSGDTRVSVFDQHQISRSCRYPQWIEKMVLLNFNYHVEHHLFPTLPWLQLSEAHKRMEPMLEDEYNVESGFTWILRNRRRRLTDVIYQSPEPQQSPAETSVENLAA